MRKCRHVLEAARLDDYCRISRIRLAFRIIESRRVGICRTDAYKSLRLLGTRRIGDLKSLSEGGVMELSGKDKLTILRDLEIKLPHLELTADSPYLTLGCDSELGICVLAHDGYLVIMLRLLV